MIQAATASVWHASLFGDDELASLFTEVAFVERFGAFEMALTRALSDHGLIDAGLAEKAMAAIRSFAPDIAALRRDMAGDGVPVPAYVRQLKAAAGDAAGAIHAGATSQDLIDTATAMALRDASTLLAGRIEAVLSALGDLDARYGSHRLTGRTRMQAALPIGVCDRLSAWSTPVTGSLDRLARVRDDAAQLQFGGPVGLGPETLGEAGPAVAGAMAAELGLRLPARPWHTDRSAFVAFGNWLSMVTGAVGKIGQDVALMAQQGIDEIELSSGGTSSAMPHKHNPVVAEKLVTLARFNAVQIGGLHQAMVHEQERSGSAWMLEWMILPPMVEATGRALTDARAMLGSVTRIGVRR
ncbi:3-carboxy-cis,cis-muconate cycloisomerase [Oceaniradius stylonematis]|uniref:3-carboxy-cis,cis-muconate cycloisomerase n=1 Tax=Oceaniradius stylonematis TaxID=2184161 RepID=UPI00273DE989|nr:3-carboxy-cis,cis-muconate cycloisomerase [Oceaniradius stylonematis]